MGYIPVSIASARPAVQPLPCMSVLMVQRIQETTIAEVNFNCFVTGLCSPTLPFILLSDVFDCITLELCEELFAFVEEHVSTWTKVSGRQFLVQYANLYAVIPTCRSKCLANSSRLHDTCLNKHSMRNL